MTTENVSPRPEAEVFRALSELCSKRGFIHALAHIFWRDNTVAYLGEMTPEALMPMYSRDALIRTESAVLVGLLVQQPIDIEPVDAPTLQDYIADADRLLAEMHDALKAPMMAHVHARLASAGAGEQLTEGEFLREAIFYAPVSAYHFQFLDLAPLRYAQDAEWLALNKGFTISQAASVAAMIWDVLQEQLAEAIER